jgi:hypothetical protein
MTLPLGSWLSRGRRTKATDPVVGPVLPPTGVAITDPAIIGPQGITLLLHPQIGYDAIAANGQLGIGTSRVIAVGGQLNAASGTGPGAGPAVTCAGASESFDCGRTWRDLTLPFDGQKERWIHATYLLGKFVIASRYVDNGVPVSNLMWADIKPAGQTLDWKQCGLVTFGTRRGVDITWIGELPEGISTSRLLVAGARNNVPFIAYSNVIENSLSTALDFPFTDAPVTFKSVMTAGVSVVGGGFATPTNGRRAILFGLNQVVQFRTAGAGLAPQVIASDAAPWGSAAASTAGFVYAATASSDLKAVAIVSDSFNFNAFSGDYPPGSRVCHIDIPSITNVSQGSGWTAPGYNWSAVAQFAGLPGGASASFEGAACAWEPYAVRSNQCIVGYDRGSFSSQAGYAAADSPFFTGYRIPESKAWKGVTYTDGTFYPGGISPNFVACSRDGHLLCLKS